MHTGKMNIGYVGLILCLFLGLMMTNAARATAESRPLPADGMLGTLKPSAIPSIVIDNKVVPLSPAAQIRDQRNLIIQTRAIKGPDVYVLYEKNKLGQIERMWILTEEEYQRIKSGAKK
jgi:hypothetical protein